LKEITPPFNFSGLERKWDKKKARRDGKEE
jgi:hypothetical protein